MTNNTFSLNNLRDMGGLSCGGGLKIKSGMIYRSPVPIANSDEEKSFLNKIRVDDIFDLRDVEEYTEKPDYPIGGARIIHAPVVSGRKYKYIIVSKKAKLRVALLRGKKMGELKQSKLDSYAEMPFSTAYNRVFAAMDRGESFLFHCTEGKDRTGVLAAIIEYCFGRNYDEILSEYLLSNEKRPAKNRQFMRKLGFPQSLIDDVRFCETTHKELFDISLNEILKKYGSVDNYLASVFGITPNRIARWKAIYTEKSNSSEVME